MTKSTKNVVSKETNQKIRSILSDLRKKDDIFFTLLKDMRNSPTETYS